MGEYKSNSYVMKDKRNNDTPNKKVEKVISGSVKLRKKSAIQKIIGAFVPEDVDNIGAYIIEDIIVPASKDICLDAVKAILGVNGRSSNNSNRESYRKYYEKDRRDYSRTRTSSRDYNNIFLDNRADAEEVLMKMDELISMYGVASVNDLYDLVGKTGDYTDEKYGWTDIRSASVVRTYDGYKLKLPRALPIN